MNRTPLSRLQSLLQEKKLDAFFVSAVPTITYLTNFSGFDNEDRNAFLLISKNAAYIFTHGIYKEAALNFINNFTLVEITSTQPLSHSIQELVKKHKIKKLGFEAGNLTYLEYLSLTKKTSPDVLTPADTISDSLRVIKSDEEIAKIQKACALGDAAFTYLLTQIKSGVSEKNVALQFELFIKKEGATLSFDTIVAFGSNGSLPHHIPTNKKLTKNSFIVLDFGVKIDGYCSDMTRTVFLGKATAEQKKRYTTVLNAQQKAIEYIEQSWAESNSGDPSKDHIKGAAADKIARDYILAQGYPDMPHSLGHGIGLLVHEQPRLSPHTKDILTQGMVFSVEPGIYIPTEEGIRIEDLLVITKNTVKLLTNAPKHLIELS